MQGSPAAVGYFSDEFEQWSEQLAGDDRFAVGDLFDDPGELFGVGFFGDVADGAGARVCRAARGSPAEMVSTRVVGETASTWVIRSVAPAGGMSSSVTSTVGR